MNQAGAFEVLDSIAAEGEPLAESASPTGDAKWCIQNVKILGKVSKNGKRRYSDACLKEAVRLYENKAVCKDHNQNPSPADLALCAAPIRDPDDILGYFNEVVLTSDGLRGKLHFTRRGELAESVIVASRDNPSLYGFSHHVPRGGWRSHVENGVEVIDQILQVTSVDLVTNGNTTYGLHEGVTVDNPSPVTLTQDQLDVLLAIPGKIEQLANGLAGLKESVAAPVVPDAPVLLGHDGAASLLESAGISITPKLLKSLSTQTKEQAESLLESVKAEKARADDAEKRLNVLNPSDTSKSAARTAGGALVESAGTTPVPKPGEYKPQFVKEVPTASLN